MATRPFRKLLLSEDGPIGTVTCLQVFSAINWPTGPFTQLQMPTADMGSSSSASLHTFSNSANTATTSSTQDSEKELLLLGVDKDCHVYDLHSMRKLATFSHSFNVLAIAGHNITSPGSSSRGRSVCVCVGETRTICAWDVGSVCLFRLISLGDPNRPPLLIKDLTVISTPRGRKNGLENEIVTYVLFGCGKDHSGGCFFHSIVSLVMENFRNIVRA